MGIALSHDLANNIALSKQVRMSVAGTDSQVVEQTPSIGRTRIKALRALTAVVFFGAVGIAMVGWFGFLVWLGLAFVGF